MERHYNSCIIIIVISALLLAINGAIALHIDNKVSTVHAFGIGENVVVTDDTSTRPSYHDYLRNRKTFLQRELSRGIGADITLNDREVLANEIIMDAKNEELRAGFANPFKFIPSRHIFEVLDQLKSSRLFNLIRHMPKGAILHAHDMALCSTDFLVTLTYRPYLWECRNSTKNSISFKFSRTAPTSTQGCRWTLVSSERKRMGKELYDIELRKHFTLYTKNPLTEFKDINDVWSRFINIFITIEPLVTFLPVWKDYFSRALTEMYEDNVQYLEFRGVLPELYDLEGTKYSKADVVQVYYDTLNDFKQGHPNFIGAKFIYGPNRKVNDSTFSEYMRTVVELQKQFPNFLAGFDLVGQEDLGRPLADFAETLLALPGNINFFFHAGETNWYGSSTDENLIDAVLLGTKRIGHGYAIMKHPSVLEVVKERGIAIEVNPISNQVLKLNTDNRNHPCSFLFANNYPVVISSDDPSFWEATPLSHDFYIAFLGMASDHSDLRTLKQLAINSIAYSSLNSAEKEIAFSKWQTKWDEYIEWVIQRGNACTVSNLIH